MRGAAGDVLLNRCAPAFGDGLGSMGGSERPNPRTVSNAVVYQAEPRPSTRDLNDLWWAFGQFLDHDITLTHDSHTEFIGIRVPSGDFAFDPDSTGAAMLPMMRSAGEPDDEGLRRYRNELTAYIDAGNVYGSDAERAAYLRSFEGGRLRVTSANLPIFNTLNGEYAAPVDPNAPPMDGQRGPSHRLLVCGDARANENSLLASLHVVWVREHNRLCDSLARAWPNASDEELYQRARALVAGTLQHITNAEWLPAMGIELPDYTGYDPGVHAGISNEFAAAGFRFGHSLVGGELELRGPDGELSAASPLSLREVFFDPVAVVREAGVDALLRGAAQHHQQELDCEVVEDLRSFLFGAPGAGGLDLAAVNINRGRDRGLADFNAVRAELGLAPYADFAELTGADRGLAARLQAVYDGVDDLDLWVGLLAEAKRDGVGETLRILLTEQFERLRDGDRFYFEHDPGLGARERNWIAEQTLAGVIARNTEVRLREASFTVGGVSGSAFAKTDNGAVWRARIAGDALTLSGLAAGATVDVEIADPLGRRLGAWRGERVTGFGESRLLLNGVRPAGMRVVTVRMGAQATSRVIWDAGG